MGSLGLFDAYNSASSDVLIKYTYYGDATLQGQVTGTDYSRIDNGYLTNGLGWFNGDFNFDGIINGSDYTLIDNAFNQQGASLAAQIASPSATASAEVASSSVIPNKTARGSSVRRQATFVPSVFNVSTPITIAGALNGTIEVLLQKKDRLDALSFAG